MRRQRRVSGETLVETLAAILIVTLSSLLFLQMVLSSVRINRDVGKLDGEYRAALSAAEEQREAASSGAVSVDGRSYEVDYYGSSAGGGLASYSAKGGG